MICLDLEFVDSFTNCFGKTFCLVELNRGIYTICNAYETSIIIAKLI